MTKPARAQIIDGKALAKRVRTEAAKGAVEVLERVGRRPCLAVVLVGEDAASLTYVSNKARACKEAGVDTLDLRLDASTSEAQLLGRVRELGSDERVDAILVQLPLPKQIRSQTILEAIPAAKDADGFHPENVGRLWSGLPGIRPCTPAGIVRILKEQGTPLAGRRAVVIGRSNIVGKPTAALLLEAHATVTICHSRTADLADRVKEAEIVVAAAGKPELVRASWIRPGATVIDVGIHRRPDGKLCGDVAFDEVVEVAGALTPVPGGVGPMTIAYLVANTVECAARRHWD